MDAQEHRLINRVQWGCVVLTRTYAPKTREPMGFQVRCKAPLHNLAGQPICQKTASFGEFGEENLERMLKTWIVWGMHKTDKAAHKAVWKDVVDACVAGALPLDEDLNANHKFDDWGAALAADHHQVKRRRRTAKGPETG